jgi:hypothetical protein
MVAPVATDMAYAAGFFDGEGSINIKNPGKSPKGAGHSLVVSASQTVPAPLLWIKDRWGGSVRPLRKRSSPAWEWCAGSKLAFRFLQDILPYLTVKRDQAIIAIEFQSRKKNTGRRGCPENHKKDKESRDRLHSIRAKALVMVPESVGTAMALAVA